MSRTVSDEEHGPAFRLLIVVLLSPTSMTEISFEGILHYRTNQVIANIDDPKLPKGYLLFPYVAIETLIWESWKET